MQYVEIISSNQKGKVYGSLAELNGLKYVPCVYNRSDPRFRPQLANQLGGDNFVVGVKWLLQCIRKALNSTRGTPNSPLPPKAWQAVDGLI